MRFVSLSSARFSPWLGKLAGGAVIVAAVLFLAALRMEWISVLPAHSHSEPPTRTETATAPTTVRLPPEKIAGADFQLATAAIKSIRATRTVPGVINYDSARRRPINAPAPGVIVDVNAAPGEMIEAGRPLAVLSSPEVGLARDESLKRESEAAITRRQLNRAEELAANLTELFQLLRRRPPVEEVEKAVEDKPLGAYREDVLSAYSKLLFAESTAGGVNSLSDSGVLSKRVAEERRSAREVAAAKFQAVCETSRFEATQDADKARSAAEQAERLWQVARQTVADLQGPNVAMDRPIDRNKLSELILVSPLSGRVEERLAVKAARVVAGAPLFVIADTAVMWAEAEIHERDWRALEVVTGGEIAVRLPALDNAKTTGKILFIGSQVSADTRSIPLVAELDNANGKLKPGMFAWIEAPLEKPREALVVPAGAVMRHENQAFVFTSEGADGFRRIDVRTGWESQDEIEIVAGLKAGDQVVARDTFLLKSELLLEREE